jgi:outer membrane protein assembly factor BamB
MSKFIYFGLLVFIWMPGFGQIEEFDGGVIISDTNYKQFWELTWSSQLNTAFNCYGYTGDPLLYKGVIFTNCENEFGLDAITGKKLKFNDAESLLEIRNKGVSGHVLFNTREEAVVVNISNGEIVYSHARETFRRFPKRSSPVVIHNQKLYFAKEDTIFSSVDLATGEENWNLVLDSDIYDCVLQDEKNLYIGTEAYLYAIDKHSAIVQWKIETGTQISKLYKNNNNIYFIVKKRGLFSVNIPNKQINWIYKEIESFPQEPKLIISDSSIYFVGRFLQCIDRATGKLIWKNYDTEIMGHARNIGETKNYLFGYFYEGEYVELMVYRKSDGNWMEYFSLPEEDNYQVYHFGSNLYQDHIIVLSPDLSKVYSFKLLIK